MIAEGYLIVDYRTGDMRLRKKWPMYLGPYEVMTKLKINVVVPETPPIQTFIGTIETPGVSLFEVVLEDAL